MVRTGREALVRRGRVVAVWRHRMQFGSRFKEMLVVTSVLFSIISIHTNEYPCLSEAYLLPCKAMPILSPTTRLG